MKKIAIRKLNRTMLKKEGTKEIYITGKNVLMPFFGFENVDDLPTSRRNPDAERVFYSKRDYLIENNEKTMTLKVTKENNEVRLTGFENYFTEKGLKEVDKLVLECIEAGNREKKYLLDYVKCLEMRVLQTYNAKDNLENYEVSENEKGVIQFIEKEEDVKEYPNAYWLWDDDFDQTRWEELLNKPIESVFTVKGSVQKKQIKISRLENSFKKLMKAQSNSQNKIITQDKELYIIEEYINEQWVIADFQGGYNLEFVDEKRRIRITNRDAESFTYYEGGVQ